MNKNKLTKRILEILETSPIMKNAYKNGKAIAKINKDHFLVVYSTDSAEWQAVVICVNFKTWAVVQEDCPLSSS